MPTSDDEIEYMRTVPYQSGAVRSLMYAMVTTRPDIAYAVGKISQYMTNPGREHWNAVKRIMRYLKGTILEGIEFSGSCNNVCVIGYSDTDWAGDLYS